MREEQPFLRGCTETLPRRGRDRVPHSPRYRAAQPRSHFGSDSPGDFVAQSSPVFSKLFTHALRPSPWPLRSPSFASTRPPFVSNTSSSNLPSTHETPLYRYLQPPRAPCRNFLPSPTRPFAQSSPGGSATPSYSYGSTPSPGATPAPGYSSSTSNFQSGSEGSLQYPGGLNFKVPVSLTGHSFALKYFVCVEVFQRFFRESSGFLDWLERR